MSMPGDRCLFLGQLPWDKEHSRKVARYAKEELDKKRDPSKKSNKRKKGPLPKIMPWVNMPFTSEPDHPQVPYQGGSLSNSPTKPPASQETSRIKHNETDIWTLCT